MLLDESLRLKIARLKNTKPDSELGSSGDEHPPEIESHFDRLSNLLNKLKSITDQSPDINSRYSSLSHDFEMLVIAALREAECADFIERSMETDLTRLCGELKHKDQGLQARAMALARLEETSKAKLAELESRIQNLERERQQLTSEKDYLAKRLNEAELSAKQAKAEARQFKERLEAEFSDRRRFMAEREESLAAREADLPRADAEQKADIENLQLRLQDTQAKLSSQEKALEEKESEIRAAAVREAELAKLIERLSSECERLGAEASEKQLVTSRPESTPLRSSIKGGKAWARILVRGHTCLKFMHFSNRLCFYGIGLIGVLFLVANQTSAALFPFDSDLPISGTVFALIAMLFFSIDRTMQSQARTIAIAAQVCIALAEESKALGSAEKRAYMRAAVEKMEKLKKNLEAKIIKADKNLRSEWRFVVVSIVTVLLGFQAVLSRLRH